MTTDPTPIRTKITFIDGSLGGRGGNTVAMAQRLAEFLARHTDVEWLHLSETPDATGIEKRLAASEGFVFLSGTYWDSWGSPLQRFLEDATEFEAGDLWLGKPAAVLVTMHSVGGKEVLSRLQGVLCTLGLNLPPMSGMVYSMANHLALKTEPSSFHADLWQPTDLETIGQNLLIALEHKSPMKWKTWPVDQENPRRRWI